MPVGMVVIARQCHNTAVTAAYAPSQARLRQWV